MDHSQIIFSQPPTDGEDFEFQVPTAPPPCPTHRKLDSNNENETTIGDDFDDLTPKSTKHPRNLANEAFATKLITMDHTDDFADLTPSSKKQPEDDEFLNKIQSMEVDDEDDFDDLLEVHSDGDGIANENGDELQHSGKSSDDESVWSEGEEENRAQYNDDFEIPRSKINAGCFPTKDELREWAQQNCKAYRFVDMPTSMNQDRENGGLNPQFGLKQYRFRGLMPFVRTGNIQYIPLKGNWHLRINCLTLIKIAQSIDSLFTYGCMFATMPNGQKIIRFWEETSHIELTQMEREVYLSVYDTDLNSRNMRPEFQQPSIRWENSVFVKTRNNIYYCHSCDPKNVKRFTCLRSVCPSVYRGILRLRSSEAEHKRHTE